MLWKLNKGEDIKSSMPVPISTLNDRGFTEKQLENFLSSRLEELIAEDHLMLIGQERPFQAEADLLALDKNGTLYVFELKRWEGKPEDLLQLLRYGQRFGRYTYSELEGWAKQKRRKDISLSEEHREHFQLPSPLDQSAFNRDQVFVLVTNGADEDTISAMNYWSGKGLKIVCVPYGVYDIGGDTYLQLHPYNPAGEVVVERNTQYFVVNTNETWVPGAWQIMLNKGKAAAWGNRKGSVRKIPKGATVFLYHTGIGVIAKGTSKQGFQEAPSGDEFYVPLKFDWALTNKNEWNKKAPKAWEINQELGSGHRFRQTAFAIGEEMVKAIDTIARKKGIG